MAYLPLFMALPPFWRILPHVFIPTICHYACMPLCPQYDIQWILYYIIIQWILYYPYAAIPTRLYFPKMAIFWLIFTSCHLDTDPLFLLFAAVSLLVLPAHHDGDDDDHHHHRNSNINGRDHLVVQLTTVTGAHGRGWRR